jgi:hypothetical protein
MSFVEISVQGIHPENDEDVEKVWLVDVEFADGHHEQSRVARVRGGRIKPGNWRGSRRVRRGPEGVPPRDLPVQPAVFAPDVAPE